MFSRLYFVRSLRSGGVLNRTDETRTNMDIHDTFPKRISINLFSVDGWLLIARTHSYPCFTHVNYWRDCVIMPYIIIKSRDTVFHRRMADDHFSLLKFNIHSPLNKRAVTFTQQYILHQPPCALSVLTEIIKYSCEYPVATVHGHIAWFSNERPHKHCKSTHNNHTNQLSQWCRTISMPKCQFNFHDGHKLSSGMLFASCAQTKWNKRKSHITQRERGSLKMSWWVNTLRLHTVTHCTALLGSLVTILP